MKRLLWLLIIGAAFVQGAFASKDYYAEGVPTGGTAQEIGSRYVNLANGDFYVCTSTTYANKATTCNWTKITGSGGGGTGSVVNLLSAGALCNGVNDDTAAIQAAYASLAGTLGGYIIWPQAGKTCILTGSVTLANTQKIHVIGGAVVWQGVPVNATTGTAAESSFNATLTTTSGNWPASFAANASIQISGCSVTGYNGLGQITSGGAGGTTLTYIVPGTVTGLGAATGCTAAAIPPVFIYDEDISASTEGFRVAAAGASTPIGAAFSITQNSTFSVVSQANIFTGNEVLGNVTGALNIGFEIAHGTASNPTNDEHKFIGNNIYNASTAGFVIDFFQSVDIHFDANTCYGITNVTVACVIDTAGGGFDWRGGFTASSSLADFYGYGQTAHPITIDSVGSESSNRLAWISQANQTQTASPCPVNLINDRFATNLLNADHHMVVYECPGPLNILGGSYGQNNTPGDFLWAPSATSPIVPYGSIIGVDSSGNNSVGTPLMNVSATGPPVGYDIFEAGNIYTDASQHGVPPTTPDISIIPAITCGINTITGCVLTGKGLTSGSATLTWPAVASTSTNPIASSNYFSAPDFEGALGITTPAAVHGTTIDATGGITAIADGVHFQLDVLAGNTASPSIGSNLAGWGGPNVASFTSYVLQLPSAAPSSGQSLTFGTPSGSVVPVTFATNESVVSAQVNNTDTITCPNNTATSFATTYTIPANSLVANKILRVTLGFTLLSSGSPPSFGLNLLIGGTTVYTTLPTAPTASVGSRPIAVSFLIQGTAAAGASAAVHTHPLPGFVISAGPTVTPFTVSTVTQPVNLATNGTLVVQPQLFCSANTAGNSMTLQQFVVEKLN